MRSASPWWGKGDCRPQPAANECAELVLGLGEAAGGDCRPLRLECERLSCGERVELDRPIEPHGLELLFLPDLAHFARLPDEVRAVRNRHDEILGEPRRLVLIAWKTRLHQIEPALDGQVDGRSVDGVERALCERGKGANALDLVSEELDPKRLAARGRVHVDDAAPERELAALLRLVDPLVAGEREFPCESVDSRRLSGRDEDRVRPRAGRRHAFGKRGGGRATRPPAARTSSARARSPTSVAAFRAPTPS